MNTVLDRPDAPFGEDHGPMLTGEYAPIFDEQELRGLPVEGERISTIRRGGPSMPRFVTCCGSPTTRISGTKTSWLVRIRSMGAWKTSCPWK